MPLGNQPMMAAFELLMRRPLFRVAGRFVLMDFVDGVHGRTSFVFSQQMFMCIGLCFGESNRSRMVTQNVFMPLECCGQFP